MRSRVGNFSSSEIWKLTKSGRGKNEYFSQTALTYIREKIFEKKLGRSVSNGGGIESLWGTFVERYAFNKMQEIDLSLQLVSFDQRFFHTKIERWSGVPDVESRKRVGDIKCPFTLNSFCSLVQIIESGDLERLKSDKPAYYWQLVSNGILTNKSTAIFIVYCPYKKDLQEIKNDAFLQDDYSRIYNERNCPYLLEEMEYKDLNYFEFDIPYQDIDFLTERVFEAVKLLK